MADFCSQCSIEVYGRDNRDLSGFGPKPEEGYGYIALCESCGMTIVDEKGRCIAKNCLLNHGGEYVQDF